MFDFDMNNNAAKIQLSEKLTRLLNTTSALNVDPQKKLKILKVFTPSQISFELRIIDVKNLEKGIKNLKKPGFNPKNKKP